MAENISDINTEDEESIKHTRHDRAAVKNVTSDESSDSEIDSSQLSPLPDPEEFSGFQSRKPRILATYKQPFILPEKNKIVGTEKKRSKMIVQQEAVNITKQKKKDLEDNQQSFINEDNAADEYKDLILLKITMKINRRKVKYIDNNFFNTILKYNLFYF